MSKAVCLKVSALRTFGYNNLEEWMANPDNVYTGRRGRLFIHEPGKSPRVFHYPESKWHNPYKNDDVQKALVSYVDYLFSSGLIYDITELRGKTLGCFCEQKSDVEGHATCHAQVLVDLLGKCYSLIKKVYKIELIPVVYKSRGTYGDFDWMIKQPMYGDSLFIFNDNQEAFMSGSCVRGGGNAIIRPYQCRNPPLATGIATGVSGVGYRNLAEAKETIDLGILKVERLLDTHMYKRVFYSAKNENGDLGTGIFNVSDDVKDYIVSELRRLVRMYE